MGWAGPFNNVANESQPASVEKAWEQFVSVAKTNAKNHRKVTLANADLVQLGELIGDRELTRGGHPIVPYWLARTTLTPALSHLLTWTAFSPKARVMGGEMSVQNAKALVPGQRYVIDTHLASVSRQKARTTGSIAKFVFEATLRTAAEAVIPRSDRVATVQLHALIVDRDLCSDETTVAQ